MHTHPFLHSAICCPHLQRVNPCISENSCGGTLQVPRRRSDLNDPSGHSLHDAPLVVQRVKYRFWSPTSQQRPAESGYIVTIGCNVAQPQEQHGKSAPTPEVQLLASDTVYTGRSSRCIRTHYPFDTLARSITLTPALRCT